MPDIQSIGRTIAPWLNRRANFLSGMVPSRAFSSGAQGARNRAGCVLPTVARLAVVTFHSLGWCRLTAKLSALPAAAGGWEVAAAIASSNISAGTGLLR